MLLTKHSFSYTVCNTVKLKSVRCESLSIPTGLLEQAERDGIREDLLELVRQLQITLDFVED